MTFSSDMKAPAFLAITGGIGGAKLSLGLSKILDPDDLSFIVNTGDDFEHLGLAISPDVDTLVYTLSGQANTVTGWGCRDETWQFMDALRTLGGQTWFQLGDRDLAMHIERTRRLACGLTLTETTRALAGSLGIAHRILPMSDDPVHTRVMTSVGSMEFQHYFVREQCRPEVSGFEFDGAAKARLNPQIVDCLDSDRLQGVIVCPSNPFVSIDPILAIPGLRQRLAECRAPVIGVSPVVGGKAIKGPTVKMMDELGVPRSAGWVAAYYRDFLDGFVLDTADEALVEEVGRLGMKTSVTNTVMKSVDDRVELARESLDFVRDLAEV